MNAIETKSETMRTWTDSFYSITILYMPTKKELEKQIKGLEKEMDELQNKIDNYEYEWWQDDRLDKNYSEVRKNFEDSLVEQWYKRIVAENCNDWRDEFVKEEFENR